MTRLLVFQLVGAVAPAIEYQVAITGDDRFRSAHLCRCGHPAGSD